MGRYSRNQPRVASSKACPRAVVHNSWGKIMALFRFDNLARTRQDDIEAYERARLEHPLAKAPVRTRRVISRRPDEGTFVEGTLPVAAVVARVGNSSAQKPSHGRAHSRSIQWPAGRPSDSRASKAKAPLALQPESILCAGRVVRCGGPCDFSFARAETEVSFYGWKGFRRRVRFWFGTSTASQSRK
jgi:hypothetical protein